MEWVIIRPQYKFKKLLQDLIIEPLRNFPKFLGLEHEAEIKFNDKGQLLARNFPNIETLKEKCLTPSFVIEKIIERELIFENFKKYVANMVEEINKGNLSLSKTFKYVIESKEIHKKILPYVLLFNMPADRIGNEFLSMVKGYLNDVEAITYLHEITRSMYAKIESQYNIFISSLKFFSVLNEKIKPPSRFINAKVEYFRVHEFDINIINKLKHKPYVEKVKFLKYRILAPILIQIMEENRYVWNGFYMLSLHFILYQLGKYFMDRGVIENPSKILDISLEKIKEIYEDIKP